MLAIRRLLFPTDFSEGARQAFPQAAALADWHDAELHLLNVTGRHRHDHEEMKEKFPVASETLQEWLAPATEDIQRTEGPDLDGLALVQKQVEAASPPERIVAYAEDEDIDLIVMGTHGRRGMDRMLFGSVTEEVVRRAPCAVLTVRRDVEQTPAKAVRRILVPVDFSETSEATVRHAREIALTYGARLDLVHVVEETIYPSEYGVEPIRVATPDVLDRIETRLGEMAREDIGYEHVMVSATSGHPPTAILDYVEENDIDLIVLGTHGRTGLDRILLGSVAERVLRNSPKPVFVLKPQRRSLLPAAHAEAVAQE